MVGVYDGECKGRSPKDEPPDLDEIQQLWVATELYMKPLKGGSLAVAEPTT